MRPKYTPEQRIKKFWDKVDRPDDDDTCWEWIAGKFSNGYGQYRWEEKNQKAHRVSWIIAFGEIPDGMYVCHSCDNTTCVNPSHLWLGTHQDNVKDRDLKKRYANRRGDKTNLAKLTWSEVKEIRRCFHVDKVTQEALAEKFDVTRATISRIVRNKIWLDDASHG